MKSHGSAYYRSKREQIKRMCDAILAVKPTLVITEKGVSDLAQHYFVRAGVTAIRRVRKDRQQPSSSCYWRHHREQS